MIYKGFCTSGGGVHSGGPLGHQGAALIPQKDRGVLHSGPVGPGSFRRHRKAARNGSFVGPPGPHALSSHVGCHRARRRRSGVDFGWRGAADRRRHDEARPDAGALGGEEDDMQPLHPKNPPKQPGPAPLRSPPRAGFFMPDAGPVPLHKGRRTCVLAWGLAASPGGVGGQLQTESGSTTIRTACPIPATWPAVLSAGNVSATATHDPNCFSSF